MEGPVKTPTIFISRMDIALTQDMALLSLGEPSGQVGGGEVESKEAVRLVVSHRTLRLMAAMLQRQVAELDRANEAAAALRQAPLEGRVVGKDDDDAPESRTIQ